MKDLYIVGAGGCGREVLSLVLDIHAILGQRWNIKGFLDDTENPLQNKACDAEVVGTIADYSPQPNDVLALAIADPGAKMKIVPMLKARGAVFESVIPPYTYLGRHNTIGEGVIIYGGAGMSVNVSIGIFTTLLSSGFGHDVSVGDFSTISSQCIVMGHVSIGQGVFIGGNVSIAPHVTIGDGAYLCMGSVIMKDVAPGDKMIGNPARVIG